MVTKTYHPSNYVIVVTVVTSDSSDSSDNSDSSDSSKSSDSSDSNDSSNQNTFFHTQKKLSFHIFNRPGVAGAVL